MMQLNLLTTPPFKFQTLKSPKPQNAFFYFKPTSTLTLPSTSTKATTSTLLEKANTIHPKTGPNKEICRLCELGNLQKAVFTLSNTRTSEIEVSTYCSLLQLCAEQKSLQHGKKVHSVINSSCNVVVLDSVLGSKLVFMYLNCGDLREGRRVFNRIKKEKVFLWNFIISEYAKIGDYKESVLLFREMRKLGVEGNYYTFSCVLKCFGGLGSFVEGEETHGYVLRLGYGCSNRVGNALIAFYSKCKKMEKARRVFDELSDRDVISWNSIISGYSSNGLSEKALQIFSMMRFSGFEVDVVTMVSVLPACAERGSLLLGKALHGHVIKAESFDGEIIVNNTLVDMYTKRGDLNSAMRVFGKIDNRSVVSWTSMLAGYARLGEYDRAIELFWEMQAEGIKPDMFAITSALHACACNGSLENGKNIHDYITKNGLQLSLFVANSLMDMYAKCGNMEDARLIFDQMRVRDAISWNTIIGGYSKNSSSNEAFCIFLEMQKEFKPNGVTMACILPACASLSALDRGREIHGYILRNGLPLDSYVYNALVDMYAKCGALLLARLLFDMMPAKDLVSWTVMIAGYGMHGCGKDAITIFDQMRSTGLQPDGVSFVAILYACSHSGLLVEGWRFYNIMCNDCKMQPKLEHYACMVDLLARAGRLTKAYKFIEAMPIKPDSTIWGALLCGCRTHRDVNLAEKVAEKVFELEPDNTGYYILLANIYAEAEKWAEVKKLRERIGRRGLRKKPGCSWIEIRSKFHVFVASDRSHQQAKKMESLLARVRMRMKDKGCLPDNRYALIIAGDTEKEEVLCGHSEKLAMAYGILNLPYGKTVRVTKNLRVCGDCHEMAKFMSKMFAKEIVLRDSNRFHHFNDGRCSCRGYW